MNLAEKNSEPVKMLKNSLHCNCEKKNEMTGKNVLLCFCVVLALSRFPNSLESPETRRVCGNNSPGEISWQAETCLFFPKCSVQDFVWNGNAAFFEDSML